MLNKSEMGWMDFSSEDRDRVRDVIKQLSEPGALDELGIGAPRDAFADPMFPGFSTIQTRAKYLITIPRIIRDYLALKPAQQRRQSLQQYLEQQENLLAKALIRYAGSVITPGQKIKNFPSGRFAPGDARDKISVWVGLVIGNPVQPAIRSLHSPPPHDPISGYRPCSERS